MKAVHQLGAICGEVHNLCTRLTHLHEARTKADRAGDVKRAHEYYLEYNEIVREIQGYAHKLIEHGNQLKT